MGPPLASSPSLVLSSLGTYPWRRGWRKEWFIRVDWVLQGLLCLLSFPSLAVSLVHACGCSVYLATSSQKVPKTNISDHSGIYPVSILHSWGSHLEAWRWEGEGSRAKPRVPLEVMGAFWRPPRTLEIVSISLMCIACRKWRSPLLSLSFQSICDSQKPKRY